VLITTGLVIACGARAAEAQLYRNSVASIDFDFITDADPSCFEKLEYVALETRSMPDKRRDESDYVKSGYVFMAHFTDNTRVILLIDAAFGSADAARSEAMRYVHPLGKLPTALRRGLRLGLVVHQGGDKTTAFAEPGIVGIYSDIATKRIAAHDLEETIFHESIHAVWDRWHEHSDEWRAAQEKDGAFITEYAKKRPQVEDLAESALFAYTVLHHPGRLPADDEKKIRALIPNRIAYFANLLPPGEPIFTKVPDSEHPKADWSNWCTADVTLTGVVADILSNALRLDFQTESKVLRKEYDRPAALLEAVSTELSIEPEKLKASVRRHMHVNCKHAATDDRLAHAEIAKWKAPSASKPNPPAASSPK